MLVCVVFCFEIDTIIVVKGWQKAPDPDSGSALEVREFKVCAYSREPNEGSGIKIYIWAWPAATKQGSEKKILHHPAN